MEAHGASGRFMEVHGCHKGHGGVMERSLRGHGGL